MDWMRLAVELTKEAMKGGRTPEPAPEKPTDLAGALAQQFALIDRNMDAVVRMLNAQNEKLERQLKRQRTWNYALAAGIVIAVLFAIFR